MKTSKQMVKSKEEEEEVLESSANYLENCLLIGVMPEENNPLASRNPTDKPEKIE